MSEKEVSADAGSVKTADATSKAVEQSTEQKTADQFYATKEAAKAADDKSVESSENNGTKEKSAEVKEPEKSDAPEKPAEQEKTGAPEKYELKIPKDSLLPEGYVDRVASYAKENQLTNEQAQKVLERDVGIVADFQKSQLETFEKQKVEWFELSKADKEIGGDHFAESAENAKRAIERYGTAEFKAELNKTGLGNYPELVRIFARIGKAMASDQLVHASKNSAANKPVEDMFYPQQNK